MQSSMEKQLPKCSTLFNLQRRNPKNAHTNQQRSHLHQIKNTSTNPLLSQRIHQALQIFNILHLPNSKISIAINKYTHKLFTFTSEMLEILKVKATVKCSAFEAIVAHIWRARAKDDRDGESMVLFTVNVRERVSPPLPSSFVGNAVVTAFASARVGDLIEGSASFGVEMVRRGRERETVEYIRSVIDWLEVYKGIPATGGSGSYVSAWWKLSFMEMDLGFRRPKHADPVMSRNDEFVLLLGDGEGGLMCG